MDVITNYIFTKTTKYILVVFCFLLVYNCKPNSKAEVEINYDNGKAIAVSYDSEMTTDKAKIFIKSNTETSVLGDLKLVDDRYVFQPVIPFSLGQSYVIYDGEKPIYEFTITKSNTTKAPELTAIYPSTNAVPENLLKMYLQFSKPMQEVGNALDYISVTDNTTGEKVDMFLELNTELWNKEHTLLTLWLDPGRIKTDLIPNKTLGLPIIKDHNYTLKIDENWKDAEGITLKETYTKTFQVIDRDSKHPKVTNWELLATSEALIIHFNESLDAILTKETFSVKDKNGVYVSGDYKVTDNESVLKFYPEKPLKTGNYTLIIESKLEDLAGNNLNHAFDNDLSQSDSEPETELKTLTFSVE